MTMDELDLTRDGEIAILTLRRPMSIDSAGKRALTDAVARLSMYDIPRTLIITSNHPQAFLVNLGELADMAPVEARAFSAAGHRMAQTLEEAPFPIIAVVEGAALGGGCELMLACDIAVAGELATFGQIEALGGVMPAFGGAWRLARRVGHQRALEMMFTAAVIDADTALAYGLILEVATAGSALLNAIALADRIAKTSAASLTAIKRVSRLGWNLPPAAIDALEEASFPALFGPEQSARMRAYLEQRTQLLPTVGG
ncbi:MAG: enoyl-CoA hydratase/isomerase family protein [Blastocatellia bacterium]|nr:enoyl-CoA hydratase/isomerase family protein [Blastocatellia bacterium]